MEIANHQKAEILARALPYIQMYRKKVIVVKYGGNAMINEELKETVMNDLVLLSTIGIHVVAGARRRSGDQQDPGAYAHGLQVFGWSAGYR